MKNETESQPHDPQLEQWLGAYQSHFSEHFAQEVMAKIQQELPLKAKVVEGNWWLEFQRIVLPLAAILVVLMGISLGIEKEFSQDAFLGTAQLLNSNEPWVSIDYLLNNQK
jgi:hypothetical protein